VSRPADLVLEELADLVARRLEQQLRAEPVPHPNPDTVGPKWTDRLAATLEVIYLEQLASGQASADVVGDQPER
jgi:hypothetical protein